MKPPMCVALFEALDGSCKKLVWEGTAAAPLLTELRFVMLAGDQDPAVRKWNAPECDLPWGCVAFSHLKTSACVLCDVKWIPVPRRENNRTGECSLLNLKTETESSDPTANWSQELFTPATVFYKLSDLTQWIQAHLTPAVVKKIF